MDHPDRLALATFAAVTAWVVVWRGIVWAIDRVESAIDLMSGEET